MEDGYQSEFDHQPFVTKPKQPIYGKTVIIAIVVLAIVSFGSTTYMLVSPKQQKNLDISQIPTSAPVVPTVIPENNILKVESSEPTVASTPTKVATSTPTPTIDPTALWNNYAAISYGYSIKYPIGWTVKNQGQLESQIPNYLIFNPSTESARTITISYSTRTYQQSATMGATQSELIKVGTVSGIKKIEKDSDGNVSIHVVLPIKTNNSLVFYAKDAFKDIFDKMLNSLKFLN